MLRKKFIPIVFSISLALGLIPALSSYANAETSWLPSKKLINYKTSGNFNNLLNEKASSFNNVLNKKTSNFNNLLNRKTSNFKLPSGNLKSSSSSGNLKSVFAFKQSKSSSSTKLKDHPLYTKSSFTLSSVLNSFSSKNSVETLAETLQKQAELLIKTIFLKLQRNPQRNPRQIVKKLSP